VEQRGDECRDRDGNWDGIQQVRSEEGVRWGGQCGRDEEGGRDGKDEGEDGNGESEELSGNLDDVGRENESLGGENAWQKEN
jgi:hypothetical protein